MNHGEKKGLLLVNLGTPDAPTTEALRTYLAEFLSDPRVIETPRWIWNIILHGIILRTRPKKSAEKYATIWTEKGSPLLLITEEQAEAMRQKLPNNYEVEIAMRYGSPSIESGIDRLLERGVDELIIFPLYPQYSAATTASVSDKVGEVLKKRRFFPKYRVLGSYYKNPLFIEACAAQIRKSTEGLTLDKYVLSYHGMPKETYDLGDPYYDECLETTRLIAEAMNEPLERFESVFQSRFGRAEWLQPYAYEYFTESPERDNIRKIAVFCPGFSADCLETLEEMADENREEFLNAGGEEYTFIPSLNSNDDHIDALIDEVMKG